MTSTAKPAALAPPAKARGMHTAAWLIFFGLLVEIVSLGWSHPTAFLLFLGLGALLVAAGVLRYLLAIVQGAPSAPETRPGQA